MEIKPIIARLNDKYKAKDRDIARMLIEMDKEYNFSSMDRNLFRRLIKDIKDSRNIHQPSAKTVYDILYNEDLSYYREYLEKIENEGRKFVTVIDDEYPEHLKQIKKPPLGLYVDGDISSLNNPVAIVGTREAKDHRVESIQHISQEIAQMNLTVVSGLAEGIDTAAHKGSVNKHTIAVLPGSLNNIYPSKNKGLAKEISNKGALVSEVSDKIDINPGRFVERNRIISGMSRALIVGASGQEGGTIHQAEYADQQRRPIFLYSPGVDDGQSPDKLIDELDSIPFSDFSQLKPELQKLEDPPKEITRADKSLEDFL